LAPLGTAVRAASRRPEEVTTAGVQGVRFDWQESESYDAAVAGVDRVYLIAPEGMAGMPTLCRTFVERAVAAGVRQIVLLSAMGVEHREDLPLRQAELAVTALAPRWTLLRANWFMQNFSSGLFRPGILACDEIAAPAGDGRVSFIDVEDIAAAAAGVLTAGVDGNRTYVLTGGSALTFAEAADQISAAVGRPIRYRALDPDDPNLLNEMGLSGRRPEPVRALFGRVRSGLEAPVSPDVAALTGREPTRFAAFARRMADAWRLLGTGDGQK